MPDEELLALWVEDELEGESAATVNAWANAQPEWLAHREQARQVKSLLRAHLPASEEPPYAEFFNSRISREIAREASSAAAVAAPAAIVAKPWRWFLPATAVAGMALCFWAGTRVVPGSGPIAGPQIVDQISAPILYTPEKGVNAAYFASAPADAMVIVLDGVAAIPDSFEVPDTAAVEEAPPATVDIDHVSQ